MKESSISFPVEDSERRVVFLDIDGVMQPDQAIHGYNNRFKIPRDEMGPQYSKKIAREKEIDDLASLNCWDVAAVNLDWSDEAVTNLKQILDCIPEKIEIVLSSDWRISKSLEDMKALFALHGLDAYLTDMCPGDYSCSKSEGIRMYLEAHPDLHNYIIFDDDPYIFRDFPCHTIYCDESWLYNGLRDKAIRIFKHGFWWDHAALQDNEVLNDGYRNVVFLAVDGVLNDMKSLIDEDCVMRLRRIMDDGHYHINADVVVIGQIRSQLISWQQRGFPEDEKEYDKKCWLLVRTLARQGIAISDIAPISGKVKGTPDEINEWISHHKGIDNYVILDYDISQPWTSEQKEHLVLTAHSDNKTMRIFSLDNYGKYVGERILKGLMGDHEIQANTDRNNNILPAMRS